MIWLSRALAIGCFALAACSAEEPPQELKSVTVTARLPEDAVMSAPTDHSTAPITQAVAEKVERLLRITASGRLTPLVREAEKDDKFQSNFGNQSHSRYWFLLRRVGVDPVDSLHETLREPHGIKRVGNEDWYIWPDFAARAPEDLIPEGLSFQDRARLRKLIGEEGIARIRAGEPYPGVRLAISETGRWVYFIHDTDTSEE